MPFSYDELRGNAVVEMVVTHHTHALDIGLGQRWRDPSPPQQQPGVGGGGEGTVDVALLGSAKGTAGAAVEKPSSPSTASEGDSRGDEESDQFYRLPVLHTYRDEQGQAKLQTALYRHSDANATATCVIQVHARFHPSGPPPNHHSNTSNPLVMLNETNSRVPLSNPKFLFPVSFFLFRPL
jgi:hypothetical protein